MATGAIIVAAGSSRRMGFNKLLAPLAGEAVIVRTLGAFERCEDVYEIVLVADGEVAETARAAQISKLKQIVSGGSERHLSVWAGLSALSAAVKFVAVHDGGRPLIQPEQITRCISAAKKSKAAACARRVTETMKRCDATGQIVESIEREGAWIMETPQVFNRELLRRAYERVVADHLLVTDEVSALQAIGEPVWVCEHLAPNLKITFPADLAVAEALIVQIQGEKFKDSVAPTV